MTPPFLSLTVDQFAKEVSGFGWIRKINEVHWHHTYRPGHADFERIGGLAIQNQIWRYHTKTNGWSDIGQHISIMPDGTVVTGRDWNRQPASAKGYNGNALSGPFMFEMVGDFRSGKDEFKDPQKEAAIQITAIIQEHFGLSASAMKLHKEMQATECPGNINKSEMVLQVADARNLKKFKVEGDYEMWEGGARRTDIRESGTLMDVNRGKMVTIATASGGAVSGAATIFKIVPDWAAGVALIMVIGVGGFFLWRYFSSIKKRRVQDHARGTR